MTAGRDVHGQDAMSMENTGPPSLGEQIAGDRPSILRATLLDHVCHTQGSVASGAAFGSFRSPSLSARANVRSWARCNGKTHSQRPCSGHSLCVGSSDTQQVPRGLADGQSIRMGVL